MIKYALIGAAGYIAPRHMWAIKETGGELVAACDTHDSVGILDKYFPACEFFTCPARFERHLQFLKCKGHSIDYLVVCTPNYLHDTHIRMGLNAGANIICEKPMVIKSRNVGPLIAEAKIANRKINVIQQLRLHPALKNICYMSPPYEIELICRTPRGPWYHRSWKGDEEKSGGLLMNIGVHLFDLLVSLFGDIVRIAEIARTKNFACGILEYEYARVHWLLSIEQGKSERILNINGKHIDLSRTFENLHIKSYEEILAGRGFEPVDVLPALRLVDIIYKYPLTYNL